MSRWLEQLRKTPRRLRTLAVRTWNRLRGLARTPALCRLLFPAPAAAPRQPLQRHVVMLVVSNVRVDPRVQKAARAAVDKGFRVTVVAPSHPEALPAPVDLSWGPGIEFAFPRIATPALINHHYPWLFDPDFYRFCLRYRNVLLHCHDVNTALMGLRLARETGSVCIADFHEWFSENVQWSPWRKTYVPNGWFKRAVMRRAEKVCMRDAGEMITVCDGIARQLEQLQPRERVHVVRNIPDLSAPAGESGAVPDVRRAIGASEGDFVLLWQGGVGPSRMLEPVIEALARVPGTVFAVRGPGLEDGSFYRGYYEELAARHGVQSRLRLLPPVPSTQVVAAAAGADAGIWTSPSYCKSFYYALPNKLFEYLAAGLPVLVPEFPEAANLVRRYGVGLSFDPYSPASIAQAIARLKDDHEARRAMAGQAACALADMDAAREWARVGDLYQSVYQRMEARPA